LTSTWRSLAPLNAHDFEQVRRLAFDTCGISLHEGKMSLVSSRLERLVHKHSFPSFGVYIQHLLTSQHSEMFSEFIDTLTTNHSSFWREPEHFEFLMNSILARRRNPIRIWSAACATGEEPYTVAMCCLEKHSQATIFASDISRTALAAAAGGIYEQARLSGLPSHWQDQHFELNSSLPGFRRAGREVRAMVKFGVFNLLQPLTTAGQFDVIFCRNVMIYFEQSTRDDLVSRLVGQLVPGGFLFTGHSETLLRLPQGLSYVQPAIYKKV
jgi:chemotaxis protein methyltransferase CheR